MVEAIGLDPLAIVFALGLISFPDPLESDRYRFYPGDHLKLRSTQLSTIDIVIIYEVEQD